MCAGLAAFACDCCERGEVCEEAEHQLSLPCLRPEARLGKRSPTRERLVVDGRAEAAVSAGTCEEVESAEGVEGGADGQPRAE